MKRPAGSMRLLPGGGGGRRGIYLLPNLFTTATVFLGIFAVIRASEGDFFSAAVCIVIAHVSDGLDGRIARLTNTTSDFGTQYDSLADLVAFGVAPGVLVYNWTLSAWGHWGWVAVSFYVTCGALRLARFNTQIAGAKLGSFVGLPIPAAADMIAASVLLYLFLLGDETSLGRQPLLLGVVYGLGLLMVSNVRYYSFKDVNWGAQQPFYILVGVVLLVTLVVAQPQIALFSVMAVYVVSGPVGLALSRLRARFSKQSDGDQTPESDAAGGDGGRT